MLDAAELNPQDTKVGKVVVFAKGDQRGVFDSDKAGQTLRIGAGLATRFGSLVDLRAAGGPPPAPSERIDPLTQPAFSAFKSRARKLDAAFEKAWVKKATASAAGDKAVGKSYAQAQLTNYLKVRGGIVHFYDATIP